MLLPLQPNIVLSLLANAGETKSEKYTLEIKIKLSHYLYML